MTMKIPSHFSSFDCSGNQRNPFRRYLVSFEGIDTETIVAFPSSITVGGLFWTAVRNHTARRFSPIEHQRQYWYHDRNGRILRMIQWEPLQTQSMRFLFCIETTRPMPCRCSIKPSISKYKCAAVCPCGSNQRVRQCETGWFVVGKKAR